MKIRNYDLCIDDAYQEVSGMLQESLTPVFTVPGDNDWFECNNRSAAYDLWGKHFHRFNQLWQAPWAVRHQDSRPENFAFVHNGVHVLGFHILNASFKEEPKLYDIVQDDVDWLTSELSIMQGPDVGAVVMFGHTFPYHGRFLPFYALLEQTAKSLDKPIIFIQGDLHRFTVSNPFSSVDNFLLVSVDKGGNADPMEVVVDVGSAVPFKLKRRPLTTAPL